MEIMLSSSPGLKDASLEIYTAEQARACEPRFKPMLTDGTISRLHGDTWDDILKNVKPDGRYLVPQ